MTDRVSFKSAGLLPPQAERGRYIVRGTDGEGRTVYLTGKRRQWISHDREDALRYDDIDAAIAQVRIHNAIAVEAGEYFYFMAVRL